MRWRGLLGINMRMDTKFDQEKTWLVIRSAVVLHNLFVTSAYDHMSEEQVRRYVDLTEGEPETGQNEATVASGDVMARDTPPHRMRRERLLDEMACRDENLDERQRVAIIKGAWMPENAP